MIRFPFSSMMFRSNNSLRISRSSSSFSICSFFSSRISLKCKMSSLSSLTPNSFSRFSLSSCNLFALSCLKWAFLIKWWLRPLDAVHTLMRKDLTCNHVRSWKYWSKLRIDLHCQILSFLGCSSLFQSRYF